MSHYLILRRIRVQNANAISGLTYGFPGITNFLGFAHALSRKLPDSLEVSLGGVGVICHQHEVHARPPKGWGDVVFALTRPPLTKEGNTAPIIEEGRMSMEVSLIIECHGITCGDEYTSKAVEQALAEIWPRLRLAGGQIIDIRSAQIKDFSEPQDSLRMLRSLLPGFVLVDRSEYLQEHYQNLKATQADATLMDAWLDFSSLKFKATKIEKNDETGNEKNKGKARWSYQAKPKSGYLVPMTCGYRAISEVFPPGKVDKVRDTEVPVAFAEAAYSVGEWLSPHRITNLEDILWQYRFQAPWYVAKSKPFKDIELPKESSGNAIEY
ncbi:MAG: type I-F CRISPR-associated protein Csy2 [Alteromonadaceae bacterium]|nr:MAG: type I-F CRISPR-associated protein Csy2 [Alteromonadaceae bacterium]